MAKYGGGRYSTFKYGSESAVNIYYESYINAMVYDYDSVRVTWSTITPNPSDPTVTHWKLVKSYVGLLDNPDDGLFLDGGQISTFRTSYADTSFSFSNVEVNYSIWVFNGSYWKFCGSDYAAIVADSGSLTNVITWLPKAWLNPVNNTGEVLSYEENNTFYKILKSFVFMFDKFRTEAFLLSLNNDMTFSPTGLLQTKLIDLGFSYEPALGDSYHRSLTLSGNIIDSYKGTSLGISIYTKALTHWSNVVNVGHNLMLDYNDSSFEESIGSWSTSSGTFQQTSFSGSSINFNINTLYNTLYPPRNTSFGKLTIATTSEVFLNLPAANYDVVNYGIPVKGKTNYVFSGSVLHLNASAQIKTSISWYTSLGTLISTTAYSSSITTASTWAEFTSLSTSGRGGSLSPVNASFAKITISVIASSSTSKSFAFDLLQFAEAVKSFEYQDARQVQVYVEGEKENYFPNTGFESGTFFWSSYNGELSSDKTTSSALILGSSAGKLISTATGPAGYVSDWIPVNVSESLTFSVYVKGNASRKAKVVVEYSTYASESEQTQILIEGGVQYYPTNEYLTSSVEVTLSSELQQISVTSITPPYTRDAGAPVAKLYVYFSDNVAGDSYWIDGAMLESGEVASPYFTGSIGVFPSNPVTTQYYNPDDLRWQIKNIYNYVSNPSFETNTTDWSAGSGTLARVTSSGNISPLYGDYFGELTYSTSGNVTCTAYLPFTAVGGEDVMVSAYVCGAIADVNIAGTTTRIDAGNSAIWTRISSVVKLAAGATTVPFTISATNTAGSTSTSLCIEGAQVEYGRVTSKHISSVTPQVTTIPNPINAAKSMFAIQTQSTDGGTNSYSYNYLLKYSRLKSTLSMVTPKGSSFAIFPTTFPKDFTNLSESLIIQNSFENSLEGWVGNNSTLSRVVATGYYLGDRTTHGQAYGRVLSSGGSTFGIKTIDTTLPTLGGYYASVAIRPENSDAAGVYKLTVDFYDANDTIVPVYTDTITGQYTSNSLNAESGANTLSTTAARNVSATITDPTRWAYLANSFPVSTVAGAAYVVLTVTCTPTTALGTEAFHIDRVVFRQ
jgi:hypothetical protein